ncbi:nucleolysin TIAR-like isoform X2 [Pocillopora verrucosa]|uniref:nucleolysin TIAR-like isoform X2 n=1 Tax=Pocillopora verrucosa TaxID=203993 RepID=UPI0027972F16|nr:nucleolysin TIAR-like isoform X2 [Pocillopora verrucosa]
MDDIDDKKTSLYVGNLDRRCTEQFVKDIFSKCGKVVRCKMINASSSTDPYCFVEFEKRKDAEYALCAMNNRTVYDKNIKVNWATNNTGGMRKDTSNHYHIFVGDLDPEIENEGLYKAFSAFGQVSDCRVVKDTTSGKSKGYGFVSFVKKEDAEKAMREMKGQQLKGRNIRTNWAARKAMVPDQFPLSRLTNVYQMQKFPSWFTPATKQLSLEEISRQASPYNSTVYVGNLPPGCTDDTLRQNFSHFGQIYDIKIFPEKFYGFIKFYTHDQALDAIYKSQRTVLGDNLLKCSWGKEQTDMNNAQSAMQQWQQYYQQYYQQVYNQQPMQQQSPAQAGYVQYPAAAAAAQYVYYPQQPFGNQPMQVVQAAMPGYPAQMSPASSAGQQPPTQNQQMMGMIGPHHQGAPSPANPTSYVMQQAAGYPTQ